MAGGLESKGLCTPPPPIQPLEFAFPTGEPQYVLRPGDVLAILVLGHTTTELQCVQRTPAYALLLPLTHKLTVTLV